MALMSLLMGSNKKFSEWDECIPACLIGVRMFAHRVLGMAPYTICMGMTPRLPVKSLAQFDIGTFEYDERAPE